jgi:DNA-binding transcriptional LysR family regulator
MFIRQLDYLVTLAREKHFAKAAESCHVSQPALSSAIRSLEKELGVMIVQRGRRFMGFTAEGERVLVWAQQTLTSLSHMREDASAAKSSMTGTLRVGAIPTTMTVTSFITAACRALYPNIRYTISSLSTEEIASQLDRFELDLGLTYLDEKTIDESPGDRCGFSARGRESGRDSRDGFDFRALCSCQRSRLVQHCAA